MRHHHRAINGLSRREFLVMTGMAATSLAMGCATNPVTGKSQFMIMDEKQEIAVDRQQSPHQFSADYGTTQDRALQNYVQATGKRIAAVMSFSQQISPDGEADMITMTEALIEGVKDIGGAFYLPYRLHARRDQVRSIYPRTDEFTDAKRRLDPSLIFRNMMWDAYFA